MCSFVKQKKIMNHRETLRKRVYFYYEKIVKMEKSSLSTISLAKVCLNRLCMIFYVVVILVKVFWTGISHRKLACRFKCSQTLILKALRSMSIFCWKKQTISGRTNAHIRAAKLKCATLYNKYKDLKT